MCVLCALVFFGGRDEIPSLRVLLCCAALVLCGVRQSRWKLVFFFFRVSVLALAGRVGGRPSSPVPRPRRLALRCGLAVSFLFCNPPLGFFPALRGERRTFRLGARMLFYELTVLVAGAGEAKKGREGGGRETNAKAVYTIVVVELYSRGESSVPGPSQASKPLVPEKHKRAFSYHSGATIRKRKICLVSFSCAVLCSDSIPMCGSVHEYPRVPVEILSFK